MTLKALAGAPRRWLTARVAGAALLAAAVALIGPYMTSGTELVRVRNAFSLGEDLPLGQDWTPPGVPAGYLSETALPDRFFVEAVAKLDLAALPDDWARAVAIASHLLGSAPVLKGGAIQKDLRGTYLGIVLRGDGYCGDFVRAFSALAGAAGLTVRTGAFSFDGFGGHGHIWAEVWNRQLGRWQLLDVYQNYYFVDGNEEPLSAWQFRAALESGSPALQLRPLHPGARPGYLIEPKAWDYFRRGLAEWYVPWGNNVFTREANGLVRVFGSVSRSAEGLGALAAGVQPSIRMLASADSKPQRDAMRSVRHRLQWALGLGLAGMLLILFSPWLARPRASQAASKPAAVSDWPRICIVGPLPPPSGGMANQCEQLQRLLLGAGAEVIVVRTNAPYWPAWIGKLPVLRAAFRLAPYMVMLWRGIGQAQVVHVFANSGWAWHLLAAPALAVARMCRVPAIINYRGGLADEFFSSAPPRVLRALAGASVRVVPSPFLERVFARHGLDAQVIPNIIDLGRFAQRSLRAASGQPHLIVTRNLESIYDVPTALRALVHVRQKCAQARLTVAGTGPELAALKRLAADLGLSQAVHFAGRIDNADIPELYASADVLLNPSTADNMPISILEALASGVPVVSTAAGGVPDLVTHERTALLVPVGDDAAMAASVLRLLDDRPLAQRLHDAGIDEVSRYGWARVRAQWHAAYWRAFQGTSMLPTTGHEPGLPR